MANPFLGEIRVFPFNFSPVGWALCNGQILPIAQNTALFSLLGTTFGGNGTTNFALPNLQGSIPLAYGQGPGLSNYAIGQVGGSPTVALASNQMPAHTHPVVCTTTAGNTPSPANAAFAAVAPGKPPAYGPAGSGTVNMSPIAAAMTGNNQPHNNMPPYVTLNFCIALQGIYPSRG
jgi:microcystin-dependent protein